MHLEVCPRAPRALVALVAVGSLLAAGCTALSPTSTAQPVDRVITMAAVEPKGGVTVDSEPYPSQALPASAGYGLKPPDATGRWEVSTYRWDPGTIVVNQGDRVTLEIIGINGKEHPVRIDGYDAKGVVRRGNVTRLNFTASKAGVFPIICDAHQPAMQASLVVLGTSR